MDMKDNDTTISYSILDKVKPKKNTYNYYEQLIDVSALKIKGSSQSYKLIDTVFSNVMFGEYAW